MTLCPVPLSTWSDNTLAPVASVLAWPLDMSCCEEWTELTLVQQQTLGTRVKAAAIDSVHRLTCERFNLCQATVRPCLEVVCGCEVVCLDGCRWSHVRLDVPQRLHSVTRVWQGLGGVKVPYSSNAWRLDYPYYLTPMGTLDSEGWPAQDLNLPDGATGTWGVDILVGEAPPEDVLAAAADVACQALRHCLHKPCDVPSNAISVSRDGVSISLAQGLRSVPSVAALLDAPGDWCRERRRLVDLSAKHPVVRYV